MGFSFKNSKGKTYYLHQNGKLYYFSSQIKENHVDLPSGVAIVENQKTGLPMLKKNKK